MNINVSKKGRFQKPDLWASLLLFLGEIANVEMTVTPTFKGHVMKREKVMYLTRLNELLEASSRPSLPNFPTFLEILCGGTCFQNCSFCHASITVGAQAWLGKGFQPSSVPVVYYEPDFAPIFCCRRRVCFALLDITFTERVIATEDIKRVLEKMGAFRCDYCFMLTKKVHR